MFTLITMYVVQKCCIAMSMCTLHIIIISPLHPHTHSQLTHSHTHTFTSTPPTPTHSHTHPDTYQPIIEDHVHVVVQVISIEVVCVQQVAILVQVTHIHEVSLQNKEIIITMGGTPLFRTPMGHDQVSILMGCPHFRGGFVL